MPYAKPLPDDVVTRAQAAEILGVSPKRVTNMRSTGQLESANVLGRKAGLFWRSEVEAAAARRAQRRSTTEDALPKSPPMLPPDQDATFEELMAAADWTRDDPGPFVDSEGAAQILGVSVQYVGRLAVQGRLPWLPTGRVSGGPSRVCRRAEIEVIARARGRRSRPRPTPYPFARMWVAGDPPVGRGR